MCSDNLTQRQKTLCISPIALSPCPHGSDRCNRLKLGADKSKEAAQERGEKEQEKEEEKEEKETEKRKVRDKNDHG